MLREELEGERGVAVSYVRRFVVEHSAFTACFALGPSSLELREESGDLRRETWEQLRRGKAFTATEALLAGGA